MELVGDFKALLRQAGQLVRPHRRTLLFVLALIAAGAALLFPLDAAWAPKPNSEFNPQIRHVAVALRRWGDYQTGSLFIAGLLWILGFIRRSHPWRVAALACFMAASFAGLEVNVIRFSAGRPRPSAKVPDRLRGPTLDNDYHSFPSAHSATSFGTAGALVVALPPVGVPALFGAATVAWSRLYLKSHYPTDVWVGSWVGLVNGLILGLATRRLCGQRRTPPADPASTAPDLPALSTPQRRQ